MAKASKTPGWFWPSELTHAAYVHTAMRLYMDHKKKFPDQEFNFRIGRWERIR